MPFRLGISGIKAAQTDLNVIGNNIANVGTTGYKVGRAEFEDLFVVSAVGTPTTNTGAGVQPANVSRQFSQGNISFTDNSLDLAISGQGFFILDDPDGSRVYSRAGAFGVDRESYVVNSSDQKLMAFGADASGNINGVLGQLQISQADTPPVMTTSARFGGNLDAQDAVPATAPFDPLDATSFNNTTATTIYDSLGGSHLLQYYFVKGAPANTWSLNTLVDGATVSGPDALVFDTTGALTTPAGGIINVPAFVPAAGTAAMPLTMNFTAATQYGGPFSVSELTQDGVATGRLSSIDIDSNGVIFARYTNSLSRIEGQVALANFANVQGLKPLGGNNWAETYGSGAVLEGAPGTAGLGLVQSGGLEESNVDLSDQLVKLIIAQRNFQANTQVITAADKVTQSIINLR